MIRALPGTGPGAIPSFQQGTPVNSLSPSSSPEVYLHPSFHGPGIIMIGPRTNDAHPRWESFQIRHSLSPI